MASAGATAGSAAHDAGDLVEYDTAAAPPGQEALSALTLDWVFGFNQNLIGGMHSLCTADRDAVFYCSGHTGVVYDYAMRHQHLLQGHCNAVTACCVSADKRWLATADAGPDSMIVVWDSQTCTPIKTIFNPHPDGVVAMDMSPDAMFLVTLSYVGGGDGTTQEVAVWEWTAERDGPVASCAVPTPDPQTCVQFNPQQVHQVATNGRDRVVFWTWQESKMRFFAPPVSQKDLRQSVGAFTASAFLSVAGKAVTATADGDVVLWEGTLVGAGAAADDSSAGAGAGAGAGDGGGGSGDGAARMEWTALKVVRLTKDRCSLDFLGSANAYLVAGSADGVVRLFDATLRLVAWFEDMAGGPITSVSFAAAAGSVGDATKAATRSQASVDGGSLDVPDFLVGTRQSLIIGMQASMFDELTPDQRHGTLLVQGMDDGVFGVCTHPFQAQLALTTYSGAVHVWDYASKQLLMVRLLDPDTDRPHSVAFDVQGRFLVVGTTGGSLHVMDPQYLHDTQEPLQHCPAAVTDIRFSADGVFMATADAGRYVALYRYMSTTVAAAADKTGKAARKEWELEEGEVEEKTVVDQWVYLGRARSHTRAITGLEFGMSAEGEPLLASVGEDKRLVEYDLMESSIANGVVIKGKRTVVERSAAPTACFWMPMTAPAEGEAPPEQLLVTANDEYKFKLWNNDSKACRRTLLSPTFGGPVSRLMRLPTRASDGKEAEDTEPQCVVYSTADRVVGLLLLPLDGNPNKTMGLIAHPREVAACTPTHDGQFLVTAGGSDATVNLWRVNVAAMQTSALNGGTGVAPFLGLLDGGATGEFYRELQDFFVYAQIRSQGEDSTSPRVTGRTIPLSELPNLMRALGFYPTEAEVANLCNEVRYSKFTTTGETVERVTLDDVVRLYVNHRPVLGVGKAAIHDAVRILQERRAGGGFGDVSVPWHELVDALTKTGEALPESELATCVKVLTGEDLDPSALAGSATVTSEDVAHTLLGFEDYGT